MSRGGLVIVLWGVYNLVLATLLFAFPRADDLSFAMAYGAAAAILAVGAAVAVAGRRRRRRAGEQADYDTGVRLLADLSLPTVALGIALFALVLSAEFGFWLTLVAAGMLVLSAAGLLRERRARAAERGGGAGARGGSARAERAHAGAEERPR